MDNHNNDEVRVISNRDSSINTVSHLSQRVTVRLTGLGQGEKRNSKSSYARHNIMNTSTKVTPKKKKKGERKKRKTHVPPTLNCNKVFNNDYLESQMYLCTQLSEHVIIIYHAILGGGGKIESQLACLPSYKLYFLSSGDNRLHCSWL